MDPPATDEYRLHPIQYDMMVYGKKKLMERTPK